MSPFSVLNGRPIDQWKVTELKDELRRRNLLVRGLKDELVRRLDAAVRRDMENEGVDQKDSDLDRAQFDATPCDKEMVSPVEKKGLVDLNDDSFPDSSNKEDEILTEDQQDVLSEEKSILGKTVGVASEDIISNVKTNDNTSNVQPDCAAEDVNPSEPIFSVGDTATTVDLNDDTSNAEGFNSMSNLKDTNTPDGDPFPVATSVAGTLDMKLDKQTVELDKAKLDAELESESKDQVLVHGDEHDDTEHHDEVLMPGLSDPGNQVPEISVDVGSQMLCESNFNNTVLINEQNDIKDNLKSDNFSLEMDVKPEMVLPSSSIPPASIGDDKQQLDDDKDLVENQVSLEEVDYTTNPDMDSCKKEDSADDGSPEKLNLDRSSGDESMEEDVMESKQIESSLKSDEMDAKIEEPGVQKDMVAGRNGGVEVSAEKRKIKECATQEDFDCNGSVKRQRRWNSDNVKAPEQQLSASGGSAASVDTVQLSLRRSFGTSDSAHKGDSPKERIVPPSQKPATTSLRIDRFVRPFTLKAVQELLARTGTVCSFWMDHIKTHCYVTYSSPVEATATRNAVYNLQWPPNGGNHLIAEFVDPQEVKLKIELPPQSSAPVSSNPQPLPRSPAIQQNLAKQALRRPDIPHEQLPPPPPLNRPTKPDVPHSQERLPPPPKKPEAPVMTLDDLFKKTKASPRIYFLPLSEEQVAAKVAARSKRH